MPKRYAKSSKTYESRRHWQYRYQRVKNLMKKYPDCSYNGDFYCDFVYDPERPWCWVDFRFFHTTQKKYFAVAMQTLEYVGHNVVFNKVYDVIDERLPYDGSEGLWEKRVKLEEEIFPEFAKEPQYVKPGFEVKNYGKTAVGLIVNIDVHHIDEHVIREFIKYYRSIGEPTKPGTKMYGPEIEVIPARLNDNS